MTTVRRLTALIVICLVALAGAGPPARADGPNLLKNPSLEDGTADTFDCYETAGWGDSQVSLSAVEGVSGRAARMVVSGRTEGDRKFIVSQTETCAPAVTPGIRYSLGLDYRSTAPVSLTLFRHSAAGWTYWTDVKQGTPTESFVRLTAETPQIPAGTDRLAWGLTVIGNGELAVDQFAMTAPATQPPPAAAELIPNGSLELGESGPTCFGLGGSGDGTPTYAFSTDTRSGKGRSWSLTLSAHTTGVHQLMMTDQAECAPAVTPETVYTASAWYKSTSPTNGLTVYKHDASGWSYWTDVAVLPAKDAWTRVTATLPAIPAGVDRISFGVSIGANGTLLTDDYSLVQGTEPIPDAPWTGPAAVGKWSVLETPQPIRTIHSTLLSNGKVLLIAGSGNTVEQFNDNRLEASLWDPVANTFTALTTPEDLFCSGHATLPDGRVLIMGGTKSFPGTRHGNHVAANFEGLKSSYLFNPADNTFTRVNDALDAHWYPTLTKIENGNVWAAGGLGADSNGVTITEMFDWTTQSWLPGGNGPGQVPQTWSYWGTYPHMFLLDDGRLFYTGGHTFGNNIPGTGARLYDWRRAEMWDVPGLRDKEQRDQAASVLLPPAQDQKMMITGGGHTEAGLPGVSTTDIIDLSQDNPAYVPGPDLPGPGKLYVNMMNLPDRTVLAANGSQSNRADNVLTAAIYNPATNSWSAVAADPIGRNYHSSALLLPDGRVASFGSNPADNSYEHRISVYEPPYLFRGQRPQVSGTPETLAYGQTFSFQATGSIKEISLVAPGSATHQTDTNARLVDVPFTTSGATVTATLTQNPALLPPGPYLLFVTTTEGTVSVGKWTVVK